MILTNLYKAHFPTYNYADKQYNPISRRGRFIGPLVPLAIIDASWYITKQKKCGIGPRHSMGWWPIRVKT